MKDVELQALIALVNSQTVLLAYNTARAQAVNEQPYMGQYSTILTDKLFEELERRKVLD